MSLSHIVNNEDAHLADCRERSGEVRVFPDAHVLSGREGLDLVKARTHCLDCQRGRHQHVQYVLVRAHLGAERVMLKFKGLRIDYFILKGIHINNYK